MSETLVPADTAAPRRVLVAGSRTLSSGATERLVHATLTQHYEASGRAWREVISGGAAGPDLFGERWARSTGLVVTRMAPDWNRLGRRAGLARNSDMVALCNLAVVFWDGESRGTLDTITKCRFTHKPLILVTAAAD